jgi:glycosyltransferase involved in cell wall biosynthesis
MKILIPVLGFARTGGYRVLSKLADEWVSQGHQVDFICPSASDPPYFPTVASILWVDNLGRVQKSHTNLGQPSGWRYVLSLFFGLNRIGCNYDVVLANHSFTAWPVTLARLGSAKRCYYIQAFEPEYYALEKGVKAVFREWVSAGSYRLKLHQICNAPVYIGYRDIKATQWAPPGVDFKVFYPKATAITLKGREEIVLGCIGRLEPAKGTRFVLAAFEELYARDRRYRLRVAFGNLPVGFQHPAVEVVIPRNDFELADFYRSVDILIAPGTVQLGAPHYPVMEAMACGVPVVNTGYIPANRENSWIVEVGSAAAIVEAVSDVTSSEQLNEKVERGLNDIAEFEWRRVAGKMTNWFLSLPVAR